MIREELTEIRDKYGIDRRSEIQGEVEEIKVNLEVMVPPEDVLVTLCNDGYIKRTSMMSFTRSGGDLQSVGLKEGDYVKYVLEMNTLHNLLLFTASGQSFMLPVYQIPEFKWEGCGYRPRQCAAGTERKSHRQCCARR